MKKILLTALAALAVLGLPAAALAEKFHDKVSIHTTLEQDRIFGVVQSPAHKCENNRRIILRYQAPKTPGFVAVDEDLTDGLGQYEFEQTEAKRGSSLPEGRYFVRALRKKAGNDICKRDDSRVIELTDFGP